MVDRLWLGTVRWFDCLIPDALGKVVRGYDPYEWIDPERGRLAYDYFGFGLGLGDDD
jgi:hypothetical protein